MALLVCLINFVCLLYAKASIEAEIPGRKLGLFYATWQLVVTGLLGIVLTGDIFNLFVFLEISSLSTYALIGMGRQRQALMAAFQYLLSGTLGASFFLIGVGLCYAATGTLNMQDLASQIGQSDQPMTLYSGFAFLFTGLLLKAAIYPLHAWLPNVYQFSPQAVSALLSATSTKVALYVVVRCLLDVFGVEFSLSRLFADLLLLAGSLAILFGSLRAIQQTDLKRLLAYSSIAQLGYSVVGLGLLTVTGLSGALVHLFNHGITKAALFMGAGMLALGPGTTLLTRLAGGTHRPWLLLLFLTGGLSLIGFPGTVGFISKWMLALAAIEQGHWWLLVVILLGSLLAILYVWKFIETLYFVPQNPPETSTGPVPGRGMWLACGLLCLAIVYFGLDTRFTLGVAMDAARQLLGVHP
nr:proton-conducting transporter membrane subunit [Bowmanella dokdonensis]